MPIIISDQNSFINLFPVITDDNNIKILDIWNAYRVAIIPETYGPDAFNEYFPTTADTLFGLSYKFYGNVNMWWVIPLFNNAEDPFDFLKNAVDMSASIKIIKNDYISSILYTVARVKNSKDK